MRDDAIVFRAQSVRPKILFYGDSNMFGQNSIPCKNLVRDVRYIWRYPVYMKKLLPEYDVVESALCSRTTSIDAEYIEWVQQSKNDPSIFNGRKTFDFMMKVHAPEQVVLSLGTNDTRERNRTKLTGNQKDTLTPKECAAVIARNVLDFTMEHSDVKFFVLSPPQIRLEEGWGKTKNMGYDMKSVNICAAFQETFKQVFDALDNVHLVSLHDVEVGEDGVHITEIGNLQVVNLLCGAMKIKNTFQTIPQPITDACKSLMSRKPIPLTSPDALLMGKKKEGTMVPYNALEDAQLNIVDHRGDYNDDDLWNHFHAVFSQHSPRWLFLYGLNDPTKFIDAALKMVDEHLRHRHAAFVGQEYPIDQKEGIRIVSEPKPSQVTLEGGVVQHELYNLDQATKALAMENVSFSKRTKRGG